MNIENATAKVKKGFTLHEKNDICYYTIPSFDETGLVRNCFTTRKGGLSKGPFESLNLSWKRNDGPEEVARNYERACKAIASDAGNIVFSNDEHGRNIIRVDHTFIGRGMKGENPCPKADGLTTNERNVLLSTMHADCLGIFILDIKNRAIALCHSGWRGTASRVGASALEKMAAEYGTRPSDCIAAVSPGIGPCCFEVDTPVAEAFQKAYPDLDCVYKRTNGKFSVDLFKCSAAQLIEKGVDPENITLSNLCTCCERDLFFSYRREKGSTGAMASFLEIV
jgi:polyphenol oxidase